MDMKILILNLDTWIETKTVATILVKAKVWLNSEFKQLLSNTNLHPRYLNWSLTWSYCLEKKIETFQVKEINGSKDEIIRF